MTTDTPRTDATSVDHIGFYSCATVPASFARELERELAESKAEVEKFDTERRELSRELHLWEMGMYYKPKMQAKIDKLEAEVERLQGIVQARGEELDAIDCALGTSEGHSSVDHIVPLRAEIERLREQRDKSIGIADKLEDLLRYHTEINSELEEMEGFTDCKNTIQQLARLKAEICK